MKAFQAGRSHTGLWVFVAAYAACLIWLLPQLSLLLDEILDALTVRGSWSAIIEAIPRNAGGVPLSYFARWVAIQLLGESSFSVRLPSALFSVAACPGIYLLARRLNLRWPLLAVALFAILPLQLRYALEGRAYSQALSLSVWATVLFFRWLDRPAARDRGLLYGLCVAASLYTQPYSLFVPLAHFAWLALARRDDTAAPRMWISTGSAILLAILAFVPWYLHGKQIWGEQAAGSGISLRSGLLILHELSGTGYFGTAILICGVVLGLRSNFVGKRERLFWLLYLLVPVAGALAADFVFVYFLAIRQMIFVLVPIAVLFAAGVEHLLQRWVPAGALLLSIMIGASLYEDVRLFRRPREDWQAASRILSENIRSNGCIYFAPQESLGLYTYFDRQLEFKTCTADGLAAADSIAVAISPYGAATAESHAAYQRQLRDLRWTKVADLNSNGPRVELYRRERAAQK